MGEFAERWKQLEKEREEMYARNRIVWRMYFGFWFVGMPFAFLVLWLFIRLGWLPK